MYRPIRTRRAIAVMGAGLMVFLAACGSQGSSPSASAGASEEPASSAPAGNGEVVEIEWYVGLGTGTNPEQIPVEEEQVEAFNADHPNIHLTLTIVDSE